MEVGQLIEVSRQVLQEAYPCGWPSMYRNAREAFLSTRIGSAWGCWTCEEAGPYGSYRIGRHKGNENKRVYVDPDREWMFDRLADGEYVPKDWEK